MSGFLVVTRDVDGGSRKAYKTRKAALARFETMLGYTVENAIDEALYDTPPASRPTRETVKRLAGVSMYGTRVAFAEIEKVAA